MTLVFSDLAVSPSEGVHFLVVTYCRSQIVSKTNCIRNSNCKSEKNVKHKW